jgi:Ca2+-binding EF-hand superfamily protein
VCPRSQLKEVLFRCNIIIEERHMEQLLYKIDADGDGHISYQEFLKYFGKGSAEDKNVMSTVSLLRSFSHVAPASGHSRAWLFVAQVRNMTVDEAIKAIREKIEGRLPGGPAGLRRAFQFFDGDGSGSIDHAEFKTALQTRCGLVFEDAFLRQVMKRFDDDGSGVIDYRKFGELVMGSKATDATSAQHNNPSLSLGTDDAGTSDQMIRRKIRDQMKTILVGFRHADRDKTGFITEAALLQVLSNHGVDLSALRMQELKVKVPREVGGKLSYKGFLKLWGTGSTYDKEIVSTMTGVNKEQAKEIIREKIQGRLTGGPAGLRRAFQYMDGDGSGSIELEELRSKLNETIGIAFEDKIFREVFNDFSEGTGKITFNTFVRQLMNSKVDDHTSFDTRASTNTNVLLQKGNNKDGNSQMFIRRAVRDNWRNLQIAFKHADQEETGELNVREVRKILERHNINVADAEWESITKRLKPDPKGLFMWEDFFSQFSMGQEDEKLDSIIGTIRNVSTDQALTMIRDKIRGRLSAGPAELRRTFQFFDRDGSGAIDVEEFTEALKMRCGLQFEEGLLKRLVGQWDADGTGELDFTKFSAMVMDSKKTDSTTFGGHLKATKRESEQFIRRKVRQSWKELHRVFKRTAVDGKIEVAAFREILQRTAEIRLVDEQFGELIVAMGGSPSDSHVAYKAFLKLYGKGSNYDKQVISTIKNVTVEQALTMIRDKIRGRLSTGPSELRRTFQFFDRDGSGAIDLQEFTESLRLRCGLQFEDSLMKSLMAQWDTDKTGELDFQKFCAMILDSKNDLFVNINDRAIMERVSDANSNSEQFLRRHVRDQWKELITDFKHAAQDDTGDMEPQTMRDVLYRHNILIANEQFVQLVKDMDEDGDGRISFEEFMKYFGKGQADERSLMGTIDNMPIKKVRQLVLDKVRGRLVGGPSELRRTYQFFDRDGSGSIEYPEFRRVMKEHVGLQFSDKIFAELMRVYDDDGKGAIDFRKFTENVMESKQSDNTSVVNNEAETRTGDDFGNSEQALRRRVRENWKNLHIAFQHATNEDGDMTPTKLREVLYRYDIIMADKQFDALVAEMDEDGDGLVSYQEFLKYFGVGSDFDKDVVGTITGISVDDAITMIRDKVRGRLRSGPSELRRTFQFFDRDGSGYVDFEEMAVTLKLSCGIQFEESLLKQV